MSGFIKPKGWDSNRRTNRPLMLHNEVLSAITDAFRWLDRRERQRELKQERTEKVIRTVPTKVFSKPTQSNSSKEPIARHNIINHISDQIPTSKLTEQSRRIFKGKSFEYMAYNYPYVLMTFLKDKKELCFPKDVFEQLINIAKEQIDNRSMK